MICSIKQIASRLDISTRTVEKHLEKGLRRYAAYLAEREFTVCEAIEKVSQIDDYKRRRASSNVGKLRELTNNISLIAHAD